MKHFWGPVPAVHLPSACQTFQKHQVVAFASEQFELLNSMRNSEVVIWIGASTGYVPPGGVKGVDIGKVLYRARLLEADWCDARGNPPKPDWRTETTKSDGIWKMFYAVRDMQCLKPAIASATLRTVGGGKVNSAPHMLVEIREPLLK